MTGENLEDFVTPLEDIVQEPESGEIDEIVYQEITRQDAIDEKDFQSYLNFEWPWELDNISINQDILKEIERGMNVLSNIVHELLEGKYSLPSTSPPPQFPNVNVAVCVNGLTDLTCIPLLEKLLKYKEIVVCELQDAVNYCIEAYLNEQKGDEQTVAEDKEPEELDNEKKQEKKEKTEKDVKKKKKGEKKTKLKKISESVLDVTERILKADKNTQTPKIYPYEEIVLSHQAELGRIAQEELAQGFGLTDHLLVAMFIEYLKSKKDMKGMYSNILYKKNLNTRFFKWCQHMS